MSIENDTPRLSDRELKALIGLAETCDGMFMSFKCVASESGLPLHQVRRTVRSLARKGFAHYARGLWTDDGEPAGSGYGLTKAGRAIAEAIEAREDAERDAKLSTLRISDPTPTTGEA